MCGHFAIFAPKKRIVMAIKNSQEREFVKCLDCRHGSFMQWYENPIVAYCDVFKERSVASSRRLCKMFVPSHVAQPKITHYDSYDEAKKAQELEFFNPEG